MLDAEALGLEAVSAGPAGEPPLEEEETVLHKFDNVQLVIGAAADQGEGSLFITEGRIIWLNAQQQGYACAFPAVAMHAVVSDEESSNRACLYIQLDSGEEGDEGGVGGLGLAGGATSGDDDGEGEGEEGEEEGDDLLPELRFIPADASQLDALFQAFCDGAERNPDFSDEDDEDEEGSGFFYDQDAALAGMAAASLGVDVDELVGSDPGRFEDPEEEEEEAGGTTQANGGC